MGQHSPKMGQHRCSGRIFAMPVLGSRKVSEKKCFAGTVMRPRWPLGRAFLESILQHDPKTVQMDLMNDGSGVSWHLAGHYKIIVLDPSLPRHGRCWAKPIQSGHAVQRKRCGSLNRSFSYREAARRRRTPSGGFRGTSQATGGSLQALIGCVPVPSRIKLFQRNSVAKMEWVPRRPLGRAFSSKILGMKVKA